MDDNDNGVDDNDTEMVAMMNTLQTLGVDVHEANKFCANAMHAAASPSFIEAYGTRRIVEDANKSFGI